MALPYLITHSGMLELPLFDWKPAKPPANFDIIYTLSKY